ncbi:MAG: biopolymer transporter ExbD [Cryomorphaceae bacterium]|nr:MAG: biopolymer transporter ExbD [Cryomorphaceae bacterium]
MNLRSRNKVNAAFSMSSMTDLVFLLLIFFIIVSTLVSPYALPVDLPESSNRTKDKQTTSLRIGADLVHSIDNRVVSPDNLEAELAQVLATKSDESILLSVDQSVPTGTMVRVLDIAKRNKWKIVLKTRPAER